MLAIVLIAVAMVACALTLPASAGAVRTARLMPAVFAALPGGASGWLAPSVTAEVIELRPAPDWARLHIWRPAEGRHPALVVSLGVNPAPPDDPRVVRLFEGLARVGLIAVLVESAALNDDRITPAAPELIADAFEWVEGSLPVRDGRIGLLGFSVGGSLVEMAAAEPRISDRVTLVESFGSYNRMADMVIATTTGVIRYNGHEQVWRPDPTTVHVVRKNLISGVASPADRDLLARALLTGEAPLPEPSLLTGHGTQVLALLTNTDPARADALLSALPEQQRQEWEALSPAHALARVRAPVFLMHDRNDHLIPYVESRRARDILTAAGRAPYYSEFDIFRHVEPGGGTPLILLRDGVRLFLHLYWVLRRLE
jgi:hypothetical protein